MNDITPAEVRPASSLAERAAKVRMMHKEHIRTTLEQARDIGNELRAAKEQCVREGKPWLPWLEEAQMNRRTAQQHMRIAENWTLLVDHAHSAAHGGVCEAIKYLAGDDGEEQEIGGTEPQTDPRLALPEAMGERPTGSTKPHEPADPNPSRIPFDDGTTPSARSRVAEALQPVREEITFLRKHLGKDTSSIAAQADELEQSFLAAYGYKGGHR